MSVYCDKHRRPYFFGTKRQSTADKWVGYNHSTGMANKTSIEGLKL